MISREDVRTALDAIRRGSDRVYLFQRIRSPEWIRPLWEEGVFGTPPSAIYEGEYVSYPTWPELQYLLRMARETTEREVQELILQAIQSIPETDNERVKATLTEIATELPPDLAKEWAKQEQGQLHKGGYINSLRVDALFNLALHIAKGGFTPIALYLIQSVLDVLPDSRAEENRPFGLPQEEARIELWQYGLLVEEKLPELVAMADPGDVLNILLCPLLEKAIAYSTADSDRPTDYSYIWRPKIETAERGDYHPHEVLTTALRDAVIRVANQDSGQVSQLVHLLEDRDPLRPIFKRITLYLLRLFPTESGDLIAARLMNAEYLNDFRIWHEYAMLLRDQFTELTPEQRQQVIELIVAGPPPSDRREDVSEADWQEYVDWWQLRRLELLRGHLSSTAAERRRQLVERYGELDEPEVEFKSGATWVGPTSPKSAQELAALTPAEVAQYLATWTPPEDIHAPSPEGLSRILSVAVANNADDFAASARAFRGLEPTYVKGLISGLEDTEQAFEWKPVLGLCAWIVDQPREVTQERVPVKDPFDRDPDWGWTRKRIASLLQTGLRKGQKQIPFEYREQVWTIIEQLTTDPEPSPEYEETYGGSNMDPMTLAINTVRGEAMHTVVEYALWVRRHTLDEDVQDEPTPGGFEQIPGAREVLDAHLDTKNDPSVAVRAVYGQWFPQLYLIDRDWATDRVADIFPLGADEAEYFMAAWSAYVFASRAYDVIFDMLEEQYAAAVERLRSDAEGIARYDRHLAEHLMVLLWRGRVPLGENGLLDRFFEVANAHLRGYAVSWAGSQMADFYRESIADDIILRLQHFWEYRVGTAEAAGEVEPFRDELTSFGSWFTSGLFDDAWAIALLARTLALAKAVSPWSDVLEHLARLASTYPLASVRCVRYLAEGEKSWGLFGSEAIHAVLHSALMSDNPEAVEAAKDLIHYFGAKGYFGFRDLLGKKTGAADA